MNESTAAQSLILRFLSARDDLIAAHICPECLTPDSLVVDNVAATIDGVFGYGDALNCEACQRILGNDAREIELWKRGF